ncbi:hypothetical protein U1Q18_004759 [Sarracenia purpurea var. burkii]
MRAYGLMASERQSFNHSGPLELTAVDWKNPNHRRSVAASLVHGVYVLEGDRQQNRHGHRALAPPWWDFFHFQLIHQLVDDADGSIFGAVYQFKFPPSSFSSPSTQIPPRFVVAFRGTVTKPHTMARDLNLNFQFIQKRLQKSRRFRCAIQAVQKTVAVAGPTAVWLAGHSLGSAIALIAGKNMAMVGCFIETYLFNPPFPSALLERMAGRILKLGIRFATSVVTAGVSGSLNARHQRQNSFSLLSGWIPYLFLNQSDPICAEYIGYFEHREKMAEIGAGAIARIATQTSLGSLFSGSVPPHLLPSAYLAINMSPAQGFIQAHGIRQWWKPNIYCQFRLYQFG